MVILSILILLNSRDHLVSKTYMTRVEVRNALCRKHLILNQVNDKGENTRLRHPESPTTSKNAVLFQIFGNAQILYSSSTSLSQV